MKGRKQEIAFVRSLEGVQSEFYSILYTLSNLVFIKKKKNLIPTVLINPNTLNDFPFQE